MNNQYVVHIVFYFTITITSNITAAVSFKYIFFLKNRYLMENRYLNCNLSSAFERVLILYYESSICCLNLFLFCLCTQRMWVVAPSIFGSRMAVIAPSRPAGNSRHFSSVCFHCQTGWQLNRTLPSAFAWEDRALKGKFYIHAGVAVYL